MSNSMFSAAFDILIKISESYRPQILSEFAFSTIEILHLSNTSNISNTLAKDLTSDYSLRGDDPILVIQSLLMTYY